MKVDVETAKKLIDSIIDNELAKKKYQNGNERIVSIFTYEGVELKSDIYM
jgi:hypothetical protein